MVKSPLIIALDYPDLNSAVKMAHILDPSLCRVKVGKELFTRCGPMVLDQLHRLGFEIFLDLKYHDIPATTAKACLAAAEAGVWMINVHASGGRRMMEAAMEAMHTVSGNRPFLIAVTVLTSMSESELHEVGVSANLPQQVVVLARLAQESGLDGVVCSAEEARMIRQQTNSSFKLVTPGIRPSFAGKDDQTRIVTPVTAIENGSDYLVIGRPVTQAKNPVAALEAILLEINV